MCSVLSNPTPSAPVAAAFGAASAILTLALTSVTVIKGVADTWTAPALASSLSAPLMIPLYTKPFLPSAVTSSFSFKVVVASPVPTTQGIPNSLEIIAAWQVTPPSSVTIPVALFIAGTISGVVIVVTITSPSWTLSSSSRLKITLTVPDAKPGLAPRPLIKTSKSTSSSSASSFLESPKVVIGLDCNKNKFPSWNAHSVSWGLP